MSDEQALRAAVLAAPDDDTPRLVYADWCDDAGDADRAAFIRAQVEAARAEPYSPAAREAEARAHPYIASQSVTGMNSYRSYHDRYEFVRGFVEGAGGSVSGFAGWFADLCSREPVRRLRPRFTTDPDRYADPEWYDDPNEFFATPALDRLTGLDVEGLGFQSSVVFDLLAESPFLTRLADLRLARLPVPPGWVAQFLAGPHLPELTALDVSDIPNLGPALADGMTAARRRFTALNANGVRFLSGELQRVLSSGALAAVEELRLMWSFPGPGPLTMLDIGWVLPWDRLRLLNAWGQQLGADGVKEIVRRPNARALRWLGLARNVLGAEGARLLADAPHLNLYYLDVRDNGLAPRDLVALRARYPAALVVG